MTIRTDVFACHVEVPFIWSNSCRIVLSSCISTMNCLAFYGSRDVGVFLKLLFSRLVMVRYISKSASGKSIFILAALGKEASPVSEHLKRDLE